MFGRKSRLLASPGMTKFFWGGSGEWRVASGEENEEQERFLASWVNIIAEVMMREKAPAQFARNDVRREGGRRGMERGHDVSCPYERREKREAGKTKGGKTSGGRVGAEAWKEGTMYRAPTKGGKNERRERQKVGKTEAGRTEGKNEGRENRRRGEQGDVEGLAGFAITW